MFRNLVLSLALVVSTGSACFAADTKEVTPLKVEGETPVEVSGNLSKGKTIPLDWAAKSSVACFPATRFEMFNGNHVFYQVELPAGKKIDIKLVPQDKSKVINLYALRQGAGKLSVPPNVESAISAEAKYPMYAKRGGKIIKNADDGTRSIDFISVNSPYSILIGVAGANGAKDGDYKLSVAVKSR